MDPLDKGRYIMDDGALEEHDTARDLNRDCSIFTGLHKQVIFGLYYLYSRETPLG